MALRDLIDELHDRVFEAGDLRGIESSAAVGTDFPLGVPAADPRGDDEPTIQAKQKDRIRKLVKGYAPEVSEGRHQSFSQSRKICPPGFRKHKAHGRCVPQNVERWAVDPGQGTVGWVGEKSGEPVVHTGAMIAFYPSADVIGRLSKVSTEQETHLTFIYLGKDLTEDQKTLTKRALEGFAKWCPPQITGVIGGVGRFNGSETSDGGKSVIYASVDIPRLDERRSELIRRLKAEAGVEPERTHGYSPHITLRYTDAPGLPKLPTIPISFDSITFKCGDDRTDFPLGSAERKTGFDNYFERQMEDPVFAAEYQAERAKLATNPFDALAVKIKRIRVKNAMLRPSDITRAPDTSDGTNDQKL